MTAAANPGQFQNPGYQNPGNQTPWGTSTWNGVPFWHPAGMSRPVCIALMILGFAFWWPIGLAILAFGLASGRIGCGGRRRAWMAQQQQNAQGQGGWTPSPAPWDQWRGWCGSGGNGGGGKPPSSSGNRAFDEYRTETLRRLEDEQKDFGAFLERLRFARDKNEFDQFMAERRSPPPSPPVIHDDPGHA